MEGLEPTRENTGNAATAGSGGNTGGNFGPNSDQHQLFVDLLRSAGFTETQLADIDQALAQAGLAIAEVPTADE